MSTFISTATAGDPNAIPRTAYNYLTGALSESSATGLHYIGEYCLMGLGVNQAWSDACYVRFNTDVASYGWTGYSGTYFLEILANLFGSLMNGAFVKPY